MASILDRYGIKEVADVTFYKLDKNGQPAYPVLYLDTLKVSTIEQTADESTANGGKGNVALISWDYNKDINVTIEDALFSAKSMAIMFGNGEVKEYATTSTNGQLIMKTEQFTFTGTTDTTVDEIASLGYTSCGWTEDYEGPGGKTYKKLNAKFFDEDGKNVDKFTKDSKYFCSFDLAVKGSVIRISADSFPGTYYVVGDTWARPQAGGDDEFFQFIIPKAKIKSENTITLEADGEPSVFNMSLHVLRPESGDMMMLVKYDLVGGTNGGEDTLKIYHNHVLNKKNDDTVSVTIGAGSTDADKTRPATQDTNYANATASNDVTITTKSGKKTTVESVEKNSTVTFETGTYWFKDGITAGKEAVTTYVATADATFIGYKEDTTVEEEGFDPTKYYNVASGAAVVPTEYDANAKYIKI